MLLLPNLFLGVAAAVSSYPPLPHAPLGYSTWQWAPGTHWGPKQGQYDAVTEKICRTQADAMMDKGLVDKGYTVFVVDEPCFAGRDSSGALVPNSTTWPNGFAPFAQYLKSKGMQLGIYTDAGKFTCQGCPGSAGHEEQDIDTFVSWGASYVKVDRCFGVDSEPMREALPDTFAKYRNAADNAPHKVQISAILAATDNCWEWCNGTCDHCRTTGDITNSFGAMVSHVDQQSSIPFIEGFAGPGYFNDLDMMIVGNMSGKWYGGPGLNLNETKAHIALWAVLRSPILLSCDVGSLEGEVLDLLTNDEMLAVFNDPLAQQATRLQTSAGVPKPVNMNFESCPRTDEAPLTRQVWSLDGGKLVSKESGRHVTVASCTGPRTALCGGGSGGGGDDEPIQCRNGSCPTAASWSYSKSSLLLTNVYNGECLEGVLGPQRSTVQTARCDATNIQQLWTMAADGTMRASNSKVGQCLVAELLAPTAAVTVDIFAGALAGGDVAVVFFNRAATSVDASFKLAGLGSLGWTASTAKVRDIFGKVDLADAIGSLSLRTDAHSATFVRLSPST